MSDRRARKGELWSKLKELGYESEKPYREHTVEEMERTLAWAEDNIAKPAPKPEPDPAQSFPTFAPTEYTQQLVDDEVEAVKQALRAHQLDGSIKTMPDPYTQTNSPPKPTLRAAEQSLPDVEVDKSQPLKLPNGSSMEFSDTSDLPPGALRIDKRGRIWFREEITPDMAKSRRLRKKVTHVEADFEVKKVQQGDYIETVEVIGESTHLADAYVGLPAKQVGVYKDPRFPFKIHTYKAATGFNYDEVVAYFGGAEFLPPSIKKVYVGNDLCFDIRAVVNHIQREFRQLQLAKAAPIQFAPQPAARR